jgi:hypothetical protein
MKTTIRRLVLATATAAALFSPAVVEARGGGHSAGGAVGHSQSSGSCTSCARDSHGRIARSETAKDNFMAQTGYSHGRPGYVVDHVVPLRRGGADSPSNMQWQTKADAKAKDKWE